MNNEDTKQDKQIDELWAEMKTKTPWLVFAWAVGIISTIIVLGLSISANTANSASDKAEDALGQVSQVDKRITGVESTQKAQFDEVLRSLDRLEKRFGTK